MPKLTGAEIVVRALEDEDIPFAFGIPGTHNIELYDVLAMSRSTRPILVTDEQAASFMADAVWRASGRLGCVNLVPGAGLTHALSGIAEAFLDCVPMLVLSCGIRRDTGHAFQLHDVDQLAIARPITKAQLLAKDASELYATIRAACRIARDGVPGPVIVEVPAHLYLFRHDVTLAAVPHRESELGPEPESRSASEWESELGPEPESRSASEWESESGPESASELESESELGPESESESEKETRRKEDGATGHARRSFAAAQLDEAARLLQHARRPLLYIGHGARGAAADVLRLAERLEAPVACTFHGKGVFPETHPLFLWPGFGQAAPRFVRDIVRDCDLTLAIGCRFGEVATGSYGMKPPQPLIHIDIDPHAISRNYEARLALVGDAAAIVPALLERIGEARAPDGELRAAIHGGHERVWRQWLDASTTRVSPPRLLRALQRTFGLETIFTADSGNGLFLGVECLRLDAPGRFLAPVDYSCMGYAVPAAVGAKLARPAAPVVALAGDGAFLMTGLELLTAASHDAPIVVVLLRDRALAQIAQFQQVAMNRQVCSDVGDYDATMLAQSLGVEALRLERDEQIHEVLTEALSITRAGRPVLIDVAIDYTRKTYFTEGVVRTNLLRLPWRDRLRFIGRAVLRRVTGAASRATQP